MFRRSGSVWWVMYSWVVDVFSDTPTREPHDPPSTSFWHGALRPLRGWLRCGSLRSPPLRLPRRGRSRQEKAHLQKAIYTGNLRRPNQICNEAIDVHLTSPLLGRDSGEHLLRELTVAAVDHFDRSPPCVCESNFLSVAVMGPSYSFGVLLRSKAFFELDHRCDRPFISPTLEGVFRELSKSAREKGLFVYEPMLDVADEHETVGIVRLLYAIKLL